MGSLVLCSNVQHTEKHWRDVLFTICWWSTGLRITLLTHWFAGNKTCKLFIIIHRCHSSSDAERCSQWQYRWVYIRNSHGSRGSHGNPMGNGKYSCSTVGMWKSMWMAWWEWQGMKHNTSPTSHPELANKARYYVC